MRIVHLTMNFLQGWNYQDNLLPKAMAEDGYEVIIVAPNKTLRLYRRRNLLPEIELHSDTDCMDGLVRVIRMPIKEYGLRFYTIPGLYKTFETLNPDVLFVHGPQQLSLITAVRYAQKHPEVKLFIDNHADFNNSARGFISKNILHGIIYRAIFKAAYKRVDKILYVSLESKQLMVELYKAPVNKMEFFPLGGNIIKRDKRESIREKKRAELKLSNKDVLFVHSGKLDKLKRTAELLQAFSKVRCVHHKIAIIGSLPIDIEKEINALMSKDERILFLGWKSGDELLEYFCACDLYCQPGSQSATLQNAICCGSPVMIYPHNSYEPFLDNNGWYVKTVDDMEKVFTEIVENPDMLNVMSENSYKIACRLLDYRKIASRIYD